MPKRIDQDSQLMSHRPDSNLIRISEVFSITESVMPLLKPLNIRRGDIIQQNQIRQIVMDYTKEKVLLKNY